MDENLLQMLPLLCRLIGDAITTGRPDPEHAPDFNGTIHIAPFLIWNIRGAGKAIPIYGFL
jgi:hypothetical protein